MPRPRQSRSFTPGSDTSGDTISQSKQDKADTLVTFWRALYDGQKLFYENNGRAGKESFDEWDKMVAEFTRSLPTISIFDEESDESDPAPIIEPHALFDDHYAAYQKYGWKTMAGYADEPRKAFEFFLVWLAVKYEMTWERLEKDVFKEQDVLKSDIIKYLKEHFDEMQEERRKRMQAADKKSYQDMLQRTEQAREAGGSTGSQDAAEGAGPT